MALTKTLEEIIQEYRREHEQEKKPIIMKDTTLKQIRNSQENTGIINIAIELDMSILIEYIKLLKEFILIFLVYNSL